jgi:hypothetical protein
MVPHLLGHFPFELPAPEKCTEPKHRLPEPAHV